MGLRPMGSNTDRNKFRKYAPGSPGASLFFVSKTLFEGLIFEGAYHGGRFDFKIGWANLHLKIDWTSL